MASTIAAKVEGRKITVADYEPPSAGDVNACIVAFEVSGLLAELPSRRVTFTTRSACVTVDYEDELPVPQECLAAEGGLWLTVTGYDAEGAEVARTHRMAYPVQVARAGDDEGASPSAPTLDVVSRIDALAKCLGESEAKRAEAFTSAQEERETEFEAAQARNQAAFEASQASNAEAFEEAEKARESAFDGHLEAWGAKADAEAAKATQAAKNATDAAGKADNAAAAANVAADAANRAATSLAPSLAKTNAALEREKKRLENVVAMLNGVAYTEEADSSEAYSKDVPKGAQKWASLGMLGGKTVVFNQLAPPIAKSFTSNGVSFEVDGYKVTANGTATDNAYFDYKAVKAIEGHKYIILSCPKGGSESTYKSYITGNSVFVSFTDIGNGAMAAAAKTGNVYGVAAWIAKGFTADNLVFYSRIHDLTLMFGAGNEPSTVEEFRAMFPDDYYPYNPGELVSAPVRKVEGRGRNLFSTAGLVQQRDGTPSTVYELARGTWYSSFANNGYANGNRVKNVVISDVEVSFFSSNAYGLGRLLDIEPGGAYALGCKASYSGGTVKSTRVSIVAFKDGLFSKNVAVMDQPDSGGDVSVRFSADEGLEYMVIFSSSGSNLPKDGGTLAFSDIRLERNGTAADYVPYREPWVAYEVPQEAIDRCPLYGASAGNAFNRIDLDAKKYVQKVGSVDLGTLAWVYNGEYKFFATDLVPDRASGSNVLCGKGCLLPNGWWSKEEPNIDGYFGNIASKTFYFTDKSGETDPAAFKASMQGVMLHYELSAPVEIDLSDLPDNLVEVESGGMLTFKQDGTQLPVPSDVTYQTSTKEAANG